MFGVFKTLIEFIKIKKYNINLNRYWYQRNSRNFTACGESFPIECLDQIEIGDYTYGPINLKPYGDRENKLIIGKFCSIAKNVHFLLGGEHPIDHLSTYPWMNYIFNKSVKSKESKGSIIIGDDVWIGYDSLILSGVHIGQGAIIGAGSVVAKDVPPYSVYAGNRIVKYRFSDDYIEKLLKFDYGSLKETDIKENIDLLYSEINDDFFNTEFYKNHLKD